MKDTCENHIEKGTVTNNGFWKEEGKIGFMFLFLLFDYKGQMMYISLDLYICVVVEINLLSPFPGWLLGVSRLLNKEEEKIMTAEKSMQINPEYWEGRWVLFTLFGFDFNSSTEKHSGENLSLCLSSGQKKFKANTWGLQWLLEQSYERISLPGSLKVKKQEENPFLLYILSCI